MMQLVAAFVLLLLWCFWVGRSVDRVEAQRLTDRQEMNRQLKGELRAIRQEMNDLRRQVVGTLEEVLRDLDTLGPPNDDQGDK